MPLKVVVLVAHLDGLYRLGLVVVHGLLQVFQVFNRAQTVFGIETGVRRVAVIIIQLGVRGGLVVVQMLHLIVQLLVL